MDSLPSGVAVAVCFLHSYANPDHERAVAALAREGTGGNGARAGFVTASCEVLPEFREYERFNTTALNAYIGPLIDGYLARLQAPVAARGYRSPVFIMTSNGGVATAERARRLPVATVLSGPPRPRAGAPAPSDGTRSGPSGAAAGAGASARTPTPPPAQGSGPGRDH